MTTLPPPPLSPHRNGHAPVRYRPLTEPELMRAFLACSLYPCPACGYNLRGIARPACPECGMTLHLAVRGDREMAGPQLTRLLAAALPLGFNVIFLMVGVIGIIFSRYWRSGDVALLMLMATMAATFAITVVFVNKTSRRFRQRPHRTQWLRAARWVIVTTIIQAGAIALMYAMN